ncbi:MAG: diguanylate cyclase [Spirochaetes bacterium]|nr:diguanylate cyclase [Spirochaetota bacterium]
MGLLEKALHYKNRINSRGKKTIMDRIKGPADTGVPRAGAGVPSGGAAGDDDILYLEPGDLVAVDDDGMVEPLPASKSAGIDGEGEQADDGEIKKPRFTAVPDTSGGDAERPQVRVREQSLDESGTLLDNMTLYDLSKDILRADSTEELFDVILFSVMGQIGVSSSSIIIPARENHDEWEIVESRGVTINPEEVDLRPSTGILNEMISRKEIIDIEEFKDNSAYNDDYYTFIAIDSRLLVPIKRDEEVMGAIILGNKLSSEDYTGEEKGFLTVISEFSAFAYRAIKFKEMSQSGSGPGSHIEAVDGLRRKIAVDSQIGSIRNVIRDVFAELGVTCFGIFVKEDSSRDHVLFASEAEDRLRLAESGFRISSSTSLIRDISYAESPIIFNDLHGSKTLVEVFTDRQLGSMQLCEIFTFKIGGELMGFTMIFGLNETARLDFVHARMAKFTDFIFPYIAIINDIEYRQGSYVDTIERVFNRVNDELKNARDLNIPLTLVLLSIKNYKRFHGLFGHEKTKSMFAHFEKFIKTRLSERDFSVRYDRHKILIILPGKDKKYAVPLANAVCVEMTQTFSTKEVQLLVTYLTAEYPIDGDNTYSLVDAVN